MSTLPAPLLDSRSAADLLAELRERMPAYVPGWAPAGDRAGAALLEVYARYLRALAEAVNGAPDKNELAFLDMLGVTLLPAVAARAPVVFEPLPGGGGRVAAGARLGAGDGEEQAIFQTERGVALAGAPLTDVVTVLPGDDAYADHSAAARGGRPFTLFDGARPVRHELYVAHDLHLALTGQVSVELAIDLDEAGSEPLEMAWEYWDGKDWRHFEPTDATRGLSRNGLIRLVAECAETAPRTVAGHRSHWIRARVDAPLPVGARLPRIDRIRLAGGIERSLPAGACAAGLLPDAAFADRLKLDLTKKAFPLGEQPGLGAAFYLSCDDAFGREGAAVEICFERPKSPHEKADEEADIYAIKVTDAMQKVLEAARAGGRAVVSIADAVLAIADQSAAGVTSLTGKRDALAALVPALTDMSGVRPIANAASQVANAINAVAVGMAIDKDQKVSDDPATRVKLDNARQHAHLSAEAADTFQTWLDDLFNIAVDIVTNGLGNYQAQRSTQAALSVSNAGWSIIDLAPDPAALTQLRRAAEDLDTQLGKPFDFQAVKNAAADVVAKLDSATSAPTDIAYKKEDVPNAAQTQTRLTNARAADRQAALYEATNLDNLAKLSAEEAAAVGGAKAPVLDPPRLVWEWWDGARWRTLLGTSTDNARNLLGAGKLSFTVPPGWQRSTVNGVEGRWLRARLDSGSYDRLRLVSWVDSRTGITSFLPIFESRPPVFDKLFYGYRWSPPRVAPEHCLTYNDFDWVDQSEAARAQGGAFEPFTPVRDQTPTLYLGFDGSLPADRLGVFADIEEVEGETAGPQLEWEAWDGEGWTRLPVEDETRNLALPGIVSVLWPGTPEPARANVVSGAGTVVQLANTRDASAFRPGQRVYVREPGKDGELATVQDVAGDTLSLDTPLGRDYSAAIVEAAGLARFGLPRNWIRARRRNDGPAHRARVDGLYANATWAANAATVDDELLGGSSGAPRQAMFAGRVPVLPGEVLEVRELTGGRAEVELPLLREEIAAAGGAEDDLRAVTDVATGRVTAVWVRWHERPNLSSSGPRDRHFVLERSRGRVLFGDGKRGRIPAVGVDNVRLRRYLTGGGRKGNVPARAINRTLGGAAVRSVVNPRVAEGGAEGEQVRGALTRGPAVLRHRRQAITAGDYEALAREASPAVALAHALPVAGAKGLYTPGAVLLIIAPDSPEARPQPSFELRRQVERFISRRTPAGVRLAVRGPHYIEVGVDAALAVERWDDAEPVLAAARDAVATFLHPLRGGPEGSGWSFGRPVHVSDLAALLESISGLDHVEALTLTLEGVPVGDLVDAPVDRVVAAGVSRLSLTGDPG